jgi:hypothetical protein
MNGKRSWLRPQGAYGHEVKKNGEDSEMAQKLLQYISVVES